KQLHKELIEHIAESDDSLLEKFFDQGGLSEEELRANLHAAVQKQLLIPIFCASGETNVGVARLMDFIAKYGSSPVDRQNVKALDANDRDVEVSLKDADPTLYVFKTMSEVQFGELSFFRLYSGTVSVGMDLHNSDRKITERVGQIYILNGKNRTPVNSLNAGDIGAVVKLKDTHTGNTLCIPRRRPVRRSLDAYRTPTARHRHRIHRVALRTKRGPRVRPLGGKRSEKRVHRRHSGRLPRRGRDD